METVSLKLTPEQARLLEKAARDSALPSKSEFIRYAIARALEERLSARTIAEVFEARQQIRRGRTVPLSRLRSEA